MGLFYGKSIGSKFNREEEQAYFISGMGNDKYQITVGGFYEHSTGRGPNLNANGFAP